MRETPPHAGAGQMALACAACGLAYPLRDLAWRRGRCNGVLDLTGFTAAVPALVVLKDRPPTLWRYSEALPVGHPGGVSMGEGMTPLVSAPRDATAMLKVDYLMPTGSFKDRGAVLLVALARQLGVTQMVADSSGNAGTAIAAYAARAGIACDVYVPGVTSPGKAAQLRAYGATVHLVDGTREDTASAAAVAAGQPGVFYASHVYNPFFLHGTKTYVFEAWEQLGSRRSSPCRRKAAPRSPDVASGGTIAEGIAIARPARGGQILAAVADTGGTFVTVTDDQIRAAHAELALAGLYVEPTAAVCWAALRAGLAAVPAGPGPGPRALAPLCGSGLKSKPPG